MAENNQAQDRYNPPSTSVDDFESLQFSEVEVDDLFWLKNSGSDNPPFRKLNASEAGNTTTRDLQNFNQNDVVYQRT
jgi:hypothetical protein